MKENTLANTSVHIPYDQKPQPYHRAVSGLVARYCPKDAVMLDIGVGVGHCLALVHEKRPDIRFVGADIDQNCLDITGSRVKFEQTLLINDVGDLFDGVPKFDCVVMSHSLEHMLEPARVVKEVMKIIRPGGILVLAVPNPVRPQIIATNLLRRKNVNLGHVYAWDRSHWMNFLEVILGLKVIEYAEDYFQLPFRLAERLPFLRPLELFLVRLFPWFAMSNIAAIRQTS
jgi:2-polyprenyl-3-methyl-5-hydroxy-6-metoxy-1,4-benzoquinol methylase